MPQRSTTQTIKDIFKPKVKGGKSADASAGQDMANNEARHKMI